MIYSVYNRASRQYDYYQAGAPSSSTHAATPGKPLLRSPVGITPEQAAWKLPLGAKKIGSGPTARGAIASMGDAGSISSSLPALAIGAVALYFLTR